LTDAPREPLPRRAGYPYFLAIPTRWMDNDNYGHVNNVVYLSYFDTLVNEHLIRVGGLDIHHAAEIGLVAETSCRFHQPLSFPDVIDAGLRVARLGNASVRYEIALFRQHEEEPAATGHFVHVWVDRAERRPTPVPARVRAALAALIVSA
jgi:acyl-CoA thioester hydrolase